MYRRYYSYNDMPAVTRSKEHLPERPAERTGDRHPEPVTPQRPVKRAEPENPLVNGGKLFGRFELDDIILLVVVFILFMDECDDTLLLLALAFIFLN